MMLVDVFLPARVLFKRGMAKKNKGDYLEAIEDFSKAIRKRPKFLNAYYARSAARMALAMEDYSKSLP